MPFPVPPLPSSSSSRRSTKPTLLSLSSLSQPSYASGSTARLRSGQLGRTAGYEDVALLGRKVADRSKRRREQERKRKEAKGKGKGKVKMVVDSDEHEEEEQKEEDFNVDLDEEEGEQSARRTRTGEDTGAAGGSRKRGSIKGKEKEKEVVSKRSRKTLKSIYVGEMDYLADPNPLYDSLPSSSLLTSLLHHTTSFYAAHPSKVSTSNPTTPILTDARPPTTTTPSISPSVALIDEKAHQPFSWNRQKRRSMWMELDGDSLIALGILMEEHILHLLTTSGYAPPSPSSQPPIHPSPSPSPSPSPPPAPATVSFSLPPPSTSTARLPSSPPPSSGEDAPGASNGKRPRKNPKKPSYRRVGARPLSEVLKPKATERVETEKERKERERRKRVAPEAGSGWKERAEEAGFFGTVRRAKRVRVSRKVGGEKEEKEREREREEREEEKGSGEEREEFERRVLGLGQKKQGKKVVVDSP